MAAIGPMFGQVGFFHKFAGRKIENSRTSARPVAIATKQAILAVLEGRPATGEPLKAAGELRALPCCLWSDDPRHSGL